MAYITFEEFSALYGDLIPEAQFSQYATAASDIIDIVTRWSIEQRGGFASLPASLQAKVTKATAAQIVYTEQAGGVDAVLSGQSGAGYTVGKVHIEGSASGQASNRAVQMVSPMVVALLEQTGLMERSVPCLDLFPALF